MGNQLEDIHNVALAKLLNSESDMKALPLERLTSGGVGDVVITMQGGSLNGVRIILEGKNSSPGLSRADDAIQQARDRVAVDDCDVAAAVLYPLGANHSFSLVSDSDVWYASLSGKWVETTPSDLPEIIRYLASEKSDTDLAVKNLQEVLSRAESKITDVDMQKMAQASGIVIAAEPKRKSFGSDRQFNTEHLSWRKRKKHASMRVLLVIFAACLLHGRLDKYFVEEASKPQFDARMRGRSRYLGVWPPPSLNFCINSSDTVQSLVEAWDLILAKDYRPIYETSRNILLEAHPLDAVSLSGIEDVVKHAQSVQASFVSANHDLLGRIFHKILDDSKNDGSYYTSTAAATLLAELALDDKLPLDLASTTILDPACGTGTLLLAASERIHKLHGTKFAHISQFLVEKVLHGWDVNVTAAHLAATSLGLMSPEVSFDSMNIHLLTLGLNSKGDASAGSLEILEKDMQPRFWYSKKSQQVSEDMHQITMDSISKDDRFDIILMNPPYTTNNKRHDQLGLDTEKLVKSREKEIMASYPATGNHLGGMFLMLAKHLLGNRGHTLGLIYPLSGAASPSMSEVWEHLFEEFELEYVISAPDPDRFSFSENTEIAEMLVIMRKKDHEMPRANTKFVRFVKNPSKSSEAISAAKNILSGDTSNSGIDIIEWPCSRIESGNWTPVKFYSKFLVEQTWKWFEEEKSSIFCSLEEVAIVGPSGRETRGKFKISDTSDSYGRIAVWYNKQSKKSKSNVPAKTTMKQPHDTYIELNSQKERAANKLWEKRSRLFVPENTRTTTASTFSIRTDEPCLGNQWTGIKHKTIKKHKTCSGGQQPIRRSEEKTKKLALAENSETDWHYGCDWEKAICVYLNSTLGILAAIYAGSPNAFGRNEPSLESQHHLPVPRLNKSQIQKLAKIYDKYKESELKPVKDFCETRKIFDTEISKTLGIPKEQITVARRELIEEPQITKEKHKSAT